MQWMIHMVQRQGSRRSSGSGGRRADVSVLALFGRKARSAETLPSTQQSREIEQRQRDIHETWSIKLSRYRNVFITFNLLVESFLLSLPILSLWAPCPSRHAAIKEETPATPTLGFSTQIYGHQARITFNRDCRKRTVLCRQVSKT